MIWTQNIINGERNATWVRLVGTEIPPLLGELLAAGDQWRIKDLMINGGGGGGMVPNLSETLYFEAQSAERRVGIHSSLVPSSAKCGPTTGMSKRTAIGTYTVV